MTCFRNPSFVILRLKLTPTRFESSWSRAWSHLTIINHYQAFFLPISSIYLEKYRWFDETKNKNFWKTNEIDEGIYNFIMEKEEGEGRIGFYFFFLITLLHKGKKKISPSRNVRLWSRDASREKLEGSLERGKLVKQEIVKYELFIIYFFRLLQEKDIPRCNPFFRGNFGGPE